MGKVPVAAVELTAKFNVTIQVGLHMLLGVKEGVTPVGGVGTLKVTACVVGEVRVAVTVVLTLLPCAAFPLAGLAARVKENAGAGGVRTLTIFVALVAVAVPLLIVRTVLKVPVAAYVWGVVDPVPRGDASPKFQLKEAAFRLAPPLKLTGFPTVALG